MVEGECPNLEHLTVNWAVLGEVVELGPPPRVWVLYLTRRIYGFGHQDHRLDRRGGRKGELGVNWV